jgi:hypothetical protein
MSDEESKDEESKDEESKDEESKKDTAQDEDPLDLLDWEKKYDICLEILKDEYVQAIEGVKNTDEKANKYLLALSIIVAAYGTNLSNISIQELNFFSKYCCFKTFFSWLFLLSNIALIYSCNKVFRALLKCLKLKKCKKMPYMEELLDMVPRANSTEFKRFLIRHYEYSIKSYDKVKSSKQKSLKVVSAYTYYSFICLCFFFMLLLLIKLLSKVN